jgi:excisionase family DNA binding protein
VTASEDFISFEKALRELKLRSEELKKLVSEGEIRAFRDGGSMKFKKEDVDALSSKRSGEEELVFADALEDDTGMVTEEISEDTLLADDDVDEPAPVRKGAVVAAVPRTRARAVEVEAKEPAWVAAVAILTFLLMVYGTMAIYTITAEAPPPGLLAWAQPK